MRISCSGLAALSLSCGLAAQSLRLPPVADAMVDRRQPTVAFGTAPELAFGLDSTNVPTYRSWLLRSYVRFDLAPVLATGRYPVRGTFHWYQIQGRGPGCAEVTLHRVTAPWEESAITFDTVPSHEPWVAARACVGDANANGWNSIDITPVVQSWLGNGGANHGLVIRSATESLAGLARPGLTHSREAADPTFAPYLQVDFADQFGRGCSPTGANPVLDLYFGRPVPGFWMALRTAPLSADVVPSVLFGTSNTAFGALALPLSLAFAGLPGCDLLVAPDLVVVTRPPVVGSSIVAVGWPDDPALEGRRIYAQTVAISTAGVVELSNGVGFTFRR